ncbi:MAG: helix-turn-helix transcriptional regulator [Pseudomonadota bacterium]
MADFNKNNLDSFLGIVRKYMQLRGNLSQKDLAELTEIGVSTMSRFLNQKTTDINPQVIAKITAKLNIPLYEIIDFVDETYSEKFARLVRFYKSDGKDWDGGPEEEKPSLAPGAEGADRRGGEERREGDRRIDEKRATKEDNAEVLQKKLNDLSPRQRAYLTDFLNLDVESKDLIVDIGNEIFRYFQQKGLKF